jgi:hypothetical protein
MVNIANGQERALKCIAERCHVAARSADTSALRLRHNRRLSRSKESKIRFLPEFQTSKSISAAMETSTASTLYPKITTHVDEVITILRDLSHNVSNPEKEVVLHSMPIIGTVKLHGTHADILIYSDDSIVFQSKGVVGISSTRDNAGFATAMSQKTKVVLRLRDLFLARHNQLNPDTPVDRTYPVLIAGEWIGKSIQKDVAIAQLSKRFVIVSVNINGQWQRDNDFGGIAVPNHDIYNISRAGVFKRTLYPEDVQRTTDELQSLAEDVARRCPFAASFGLDGEGEGIVWKPIEAPHNANPNLWFKTKGGRFKPTFAPQPSRQCPETAEQNRLAAAEVAKIWTSELRLEQGLDNLKERQIKINLRGLGAYLKWIQNDIAVEEKRYIAEHKIDVPTLRIEIAKIARLWYGEKLDR